MKKTMNQILILSAALAALSASSFAETPAAKPTSPGNGVAAASTDCPTIATGAAKPGDAAAGDNKAANPTGQGAIVTPTTTGGH